jgi:uncharacterized protein
MNYAGLKTPGVYINEIATLPASIVAVDTAIPAFIGYTQHVMVNNTNMLATATTPQYARISSMKEYEDIFGGPKLSEVEMAVSINDEMSEYPDPKDATKKITVLDKSTMTTQVMKQPMFLMYYQIQMFFANGGGACYVIAVGDFTKTLDDDDLKKGLDVLKTLDEPTLIVFPDSTTVDDLYAVYGIALQQCEDLKDRFVVMDVFPQTDATNPTPHQYFRSKITNSNLKYGAAYYPHLKSVLNYAVDPTKVKIKHEQKITNTPPPPVGTPALKGAFDAKALSDLSKGSDIYNQILAQIDAQRIVLPPSAAMAGVYAAVDNARGVWKAPANVGVNNIFGVSVDMNDKDQELYNVDATSGKSINVIRTFTGRGTVVWGARTLAGNDNEWRYVNVRRFFNMVEESVRKAMGFYVFEPNDANTWVKLKAGIENFLLLQWRAGALQGAKPEHAFFVSVGLGQTMSASDILEGRLIVRIGMAVVRPAEFIILEFTHKLAES